MKKHKIVFLGNLLVRLIDVLYVIKILEWEKEVGDNIL